MNTPDTQSALREWDFELPNELIARAPPEARDGGRLLVVGESLLDSKIRELPAFIEANDLLIFNDVRVRRARLRGYRATGGAVEILVLRADGDCAEVLLRPARKVAVGDVLRLGSGHACIQGRADEGRATVRFFPSLDAVEAEVGEMPLPPYMGRSADARDDERYQTVYAKSGEFAAAAAPTAGLHFSKAMLDNLAARGVETAMVTLEVGLGTFRPLTEANITSGQLHPERFTVPDLTWAAVQRAHRDGRRIVAVGTTTVRAIESADGPGAGETTAFFRPGWQPRYINALITNFHLPRSSLLMLVAAFAGRDRVFAAYAHAIARRYRFFSYGDACFFSSASTPQSEQRVLLTTCGGSTT